MLMFFLSLVLSLKVTVNLSRLTLSQYALSELLMESSINLQDVNPKIMIVINDIKMIFLVFFVFI